MISRRILLSFLLSIPILGKVRVMDIEVQGCIIKADRLYRVDEDRMLFQWVKDEGSGVYSVGFMQVLSSLIYPLYAIRIKPVNTVVEFDSNLAVVEFGKRVSTFPSPLSGRIVESNKMLEREPSLIVSRPYESWVVKIKSDRPEELKRLKRAEEIVDIVRGVIVREKIECLPKK
ncbi:glycine cleavage system protein H [Hydrogenobacter sp. T-2]|uniref:glycine cleavage system protein H n=1 Tax=Pampinifervens diazotrophicum TaxID=1632018 RepID=UPI002B2583DD|nr:glycine cleavage system protein H [Hydrogenobacter sp. T-2]WPM31792.1 glycine cleavage system protein H [Hydrogenobacter sp. T-2]